MTMIEFFRTVIDVAILVLQCVILMELHDYRVTLLLRASKRREWIRQEHEDE